MKDLVSLEIVEGRYKDHPPYRRFLQAMEQADGQTLLDVGCGVGHYSEVLLRNYPHMKYSGCDFSTAMIEEARRLWPGREFFIADMLDVDYAPYDIVLASSLIEVMDDWAKGVEALCRTVQGKLILSRVRIHSGPTVRNDDTGYPGQPTFCHVHNERELLELFERGGLDVTWSVAWIAWPQKTYILERA